jgi:hypothetical protein
MSLFKGISNADNASKSEFYNGGELYVVRLTGHEMRKSKNPKNIGVSFVYSRANVLETTDATRPAGTSVVEMFKLKPAMTPEENIQANGPALARLRAHGATVYRAMLESKRQEGVDGFKDLSDEQIDAEIDGMENDDEQFDAFFQSLTGAGAGEGIVLGVSTSDIKLKDGGNFTQITYTTDVAGIRNLISQRKAEAA